MTIGRIAWLEAVLPVQVARCDLNRSDSPPAQPGRYSRAIELNSFRSILLGAVDIASLLIEVLAVAIIVGGITYASILFLLRRGPLDAYSSYRARLGRALLLGLEVLVAADIIRTVALEPTIANVFVLGLLVLIRTFLSWSLVVEIEGRWPWQQPPAGKPATPQG